MLPHTFQPLGQIFKKIFLYIKNIFLCKNCEPLLWLHHNLEMAEIMIWTILNLHYLRMLPQKSQLCGLLVTKQFVFKKIVIYMYNLTPHPWICARPNPPQTIRIRINFDLHYQLSLCILIMIFNVLIYIGHIKLKKTLNMQNNQYVIIHDLNHNIKFCPQKMPVIRMLMLLSHFQNCAVVNSFVDR